MDNLQNETNQPSNVISLVTGPSLSSEHQALGLTLVAAADHHQKEYGKLSRTIFDVARGAGNPEMFAAIFVYAGGILLKNANTGENAGRIKSIAEYKRLLNPSFSSVENAVSTLRKQWQEAGEGGEKMREARQKYFAYAAEKNAEMAKAEVPEGFGVLTSDRYAGREGVTTWRQDYNVVVDGNRILASHAKKQEALNSANGRRNKAAEEARKGKPSDHIGETVPKETAAALSMFLSKTRQLLDAGFPQKVLNDWLYDCIATQNDMLSQYAERQKKVLAASTDAGKRSAAEALPPVQPVSAPEPDNFDKTGTDNT